MFSPDGTLISASAAPHYRGHIKTTTTNKQTKIKSPVFLFWWDLCTDLHEPVGIVQMMVVNVTEGLHGLGQQMFASLTHVQTNGGKAFVFLRAEEEQLIGPTAPRVTYVLGF